MDYILTYMDYILTYMDYMWIICGFDHRKIGKLKQLQGYRVLQDLKKDLPIENRDLTIKK